MKCEMDTVTKTTAVQWGEAVHMSEKTRTWRGKQFNDSDGAVKTRRGLSALLALLLLVLLSTSAFPVMADSANVAMITGTNTPYATLQAAFDAARPEQTVQLLDDIDSEAKAGGWPLKVWVGRDFTLDLAGHVIDRGLTAETRSGNVITVYGKLTLNDSNSARTHTNTELPAGGVITGGKTFGDCGGVCLTVNASFTMNGGTIYGNQADRGGVYINRGTMTMTGGAVKGNSAKGYGGGIFINPGTFTMSGGEISGNTADVEGGGIYINGGTVTMNGGSITGNTASTDGGGIFIYDGTVNMSGAVNVSGNTKGSGTGVTPNNVYLPEAKTITVTGELTGSDGSIGVTMATPVVFTNTYYYTDYNDPSKFVSDKSELGVGKDEDGQLYLGNNSPFTVTYHSNFGEDETKAVKFDSKTTSITLASANLFTREGYVLKKWNTTSNNSDTSYDVGAVLTTDLATMDLYAQWVEAAASVTVGSGSSAVTTNYASLHEALSAAAFAGETDITITLLKNISGGSAGTEGTDNLENTAIVTLNLNGKTIDLSQIGINSDYAKSFVLRSGTLTLIDSVGGGVIRGGAIGFAILEGTLDMQGGTITGNEIGVNLKKIEWSSGSFYENGKIILSGGSITGNTKQGIYYETGTLSVSGNPVVTGNGTDTAASGIKGNVVLNALPDKKITVNTDGLGENAQLGITLAFLEDDDTLSTVFTSGLSGKGSAINFTSDNSNYAVGIVEEGQTGAGEAYLTEPKYTVTYNENLGTGEFLLDDVIMPTDTSRYASGGVVTVKSASGLYKSDSSGKVSIATGWNTNADGTGNSYAGDGTATFTITADTTLYAQWTPAVAKLQHTESGTTTTTYHTSLKDAIAKAASGDTITLLAEINRTTEDPESTATALVNISGGKLITIDLAGQKITAASESDTGLSVINVSGSGTQLTIDDTSSGKTGEITKGISDEGAGIYIDSGTVTMSAGSIIGNTASAAGGGVCITNNGTFTMSGGSITNNKAFVIGGGVYITNNGTFTMSGGSITGNATGDHDFGGGIFADANTTLKMSGAVTVSGNTKGMGKGAVPNNVFLPNNQHIFIAGKLENTASIGVTLAGGTGVFTSGLPTKGNDSNFTSDAGYGVGLTSDGEALLGYKVTYNGNGADDETKVPDEVLWYSGADISAAGQGELTKTGYQFSSKWNTVQNPTAETPGTEYAAGASITSLTGNITLYAQWTANSYTVKFNGNGNTNTVSVADQVFTYGMEQALNANQYERVFTVTYEYNDATDGNTAASAPASSTFNGWAKTAEGTKEYDDQASVSNLTEVNNGTVELFANWTDNGTVTLPTPTKTGQSFGGWYKDQAFSDDKKAGNGGASYTPTGSETLYAKWDGISYTITLPEVGTIGAEFTVMVNGTELTTAPFQAKYNDTVVVIYKPNDSFLAASRLHISDSAHEPVSFTPAQTADVTAETSYTFAMPDKNVTVDALIVKAPVAKADLIYNGQAQELTTAAVFNNNLDVLYYATTDNTITSGTISAYRDKFESGIWKETNAGTYYVWYAMQDFDYTGGPIEVTIAQRPVTIMAKDQSVTVGTAITQGVDQVTIAAETPLAAGHEIADVVLNGSTNVFTTDGEITITSESVKINSGNDDVTANYALTLNPGKLTVGLPPVTVISEDDGAGTVVFTSVSMRLLNGDTELESWTDNGHELTGLQPNITYTIQETSAYSGYRYAKDTQFKFNDSGEGSIINGPDALLIRTNLHIKHEPTQISVLKTGANDAALSGAEMVLKNSSGGLVSNWTSGLNAYS